MLIRENISLQPFNTFGIDVRARYFAELNSVDALLDLIGEKQISSTAHMMLGGGSNVLFTKDFDGWILKNSIKGIEVVYEEEKHVVVKAQAGEVWNEFVLWCMERNFAGIENLSLIPGNVGASPMQNIGAYGVEIKDVFESLEAISVTTGERRIFTKAECNFGYRESVFKQELKGAYFIVSVTFKLTKFRPGSAYIFKTSYGDIKQTLADMHAFDLTPSLVSEAVCRIRKSKLPDPAQLGNAGSFFKNPVISGSHYNELVQQYPLMPSFANGNDYKIPAGWLIEQCGWKGKLVGRTGSHATQALVLVNYGGASGKEILNLAMDIQESVKKKFGINISPEVNVY